MDRGPGIPDVAAALNDGYSTSQTSGTGLGAVRRMAGAFDLYSRAPGGTVVMARLWAGAPAPAGMALGAVCIAHPGEEVSGDDWGVRELAGGCSLMVADGLGHGPLAREAAQTALSAFRTASLADAPARTIEDCHTALRATRGAAVALARIDGGAGQLRYAGVGNIAAAVFDGAEVQRLVSLNGTAGLGVMRAREFTYRWTKGSLLVMTSDGLNTRWSLGDYPGLASPRSVRDRGRALPRPRTWARRRHGGGGEGARGVKATPLLTLALRAERDVVAARQRSLQIARLLGFDTQDQVRIATAVSEIARNVVNYAGQGEIAFAVRAARPAPGPGRRGARPGTGDRRRGPHPHRPLPVGDGARAGDRRRAAAHGRVRDRVRRGRDPREAGQAPSPRRAGGGGRAPAGRRGRPRPRRPRGGRPHRGAPREPGAAPRPGRAAAAPGRDRAPEPRDRGDQPRGARPLRRARREGRAPPPRGRDEVPLPLPHEPRVPHPAELHPRPLPDAAGALRRRPGPRAGQAGGLHPQGGAGPHRARERPPGPGQGRGGEDRGAHDGVRGRPDAGRAARHDAAPRHRRTCRS